MKKLIDLIGQEVTLRISFGANGAHADFTGKARRVDNFVCVANAIGLPIDAEVSQGFGSVWLWDALEYEQGESEQASV